MRAHLPSPSSLLLALPSVSASAKKAATFKVVVVGEGGVGKTTWVKRLRTNQFESKYVATLGVEVHPLRFHTPTGVVVFNLWDTAGQDKLGGIRDGYYLGANAGIVVYDSTYPASYRRCLFYIGELKSVCGEIPIVLVGAKIDLESSIDDEDQEDVPSLEDYPNFYISTKVDMGCREPFEHLIQVLMPPQ